jgi:DNA-binding SARP family transcriptional activator
MAGLEIRLLGPPEVRRDGTLIEIPRRRIRALLFYLAASTQPHARLDLATLLWGDLSDPEANRGLRDAIYRLRAALGRDDDVVARGDRVWLLRDGACEVDLTAFDQALDRTPDLPTDAGLAALESAIHLWRGPFLAGFALPDCPSFEDWLASERRRVERRFLDALANLAERYAKRGDGEAALSAAERLVAGDPANEGAHRLIMRLHALAGDRSAALRQYGLCREALDRELGIPPDAETDALRDRIIRGDLPPVREPRATRPSPSPPGPRPPSRDVALGRLSVELLLPFTGRQRQLELLRAQHQSTLAGQGKVVLVDGEAGIGKSRLLAEFLRSLPTEDGVLFGACYPSSRDIAFQPLVEALRERPGRLDLEALGLPSSLRSILRWLLPELPVGPTDADVPAAFGGILPGWERGRIFDALAGLLLALARRRPQVLVLDDLHWSDDETLRFLAQLGRRVDRARVLVVGTFRSDEVTEPLRRVLGELSRQNQLVRLVLDRLSSDETVHLVENLARRHPRSARLGRFLHQESAGNPLFIGELLRGLTEAGLVRRDETGQVVLPEADVENYASVPLPATLHALIAGRLARLDDHARQALGIAAVAGRALDVALLVRVANTSEELAVAALDALTSDGFLRDQPDGSYHFGHDKVREVIEADLSEARQALLHRLVGEALEARGEPAPGLLAYHFRRGKAWRSAFAYGRLAGERAVGAHANREATIHYTTAIEAAERLGGEIATTELATMFEARGRARLGMSAYAAAAEDFQRALDLAQRAGAIQRGLSARRYLALARFWNHEPAERSVGHAEAALAEARRLGDQHEIAAGSAALAAIVVTRGRLREGMANAKVAIEVGRETGDDYLVTDATGTLGMAQGWRGLLPGARQNLAQSLGAAQRNGWGLLVPRGLYFSGISAAAAGDYEIALDFLGACERYARESDDRWWLARLPNAFGWICQELYDADAAERSNAEGVEAARASPWPEPLGNALVNLGVDWLRRGDLGRARAGFDEAATLLGRDETMQWRWETRLWLGLGAWSLQRGDLDAALELADRALALARRTYAAKNAVRARRLQGQALATRGDLPAAIAPLRHAARLADRLASPRQVWETRALLAMVERRLGRDAVAERELQLARDCFRSVGSRLAEPRRACFLAAERVWSDNPLVVS